MRKECTVFVIVLVVGLGFCPLKALADKMEDMDGNMDTSKTATDNDDISEDELPYQEVPDYKNDDKLCLQIPQKLQVIIDPYEMDGKGQIYSEQYTIWNTGETTGVLTISFSCSSGEEGSQVVRREKEGIHDGDSKSAYLEVVYGDTDYFTLSEEYSEYQVELTPGESLTMYFTGEVNENASEQWKDSDIIIKGVYTWEDAEEALSEKSKNMKMDSLTDAAVGERESEEESIGESSSKGVASEGSEDINIDAAADNKKVEPESEEESTSESPSKEVTSGGSENINADAVTESEKVEPESGKEPESEVPSEEVIFEENEDINTDTPMDTSIGEATSDTIADGNEQTNESKAEEQDAGQTEALVESI